MGTDPDGERSGLGWACAIALLLSASGQSNVRFGQVSVFIVLATLADAVGAVPERMRGVLTGVAAAVKLTPLLFIVFYLVTGRRGDAMRAGMSFAGFTAVSWLLMPEASYTYWTSVLFATSRIGDLAALGNQSVEGVLLRAGLQGPALLVEWLLLVAVLVGIALWRGRELAAKARQSMRPFWSDAPPWQLHRCRGPITSSGSFSPPYC